MLHDVNFEAVVQRSSTTSDGVTELFANAPKRGNAHVASIKAAEANGSGVRSADLRRNRFAAQRADDRFGDAAP